MNYKSCSLSVSDNIMSHSGDSDRESTTETYIQLYKCHICAYKPDFNTLIYLLEQVALTGHYLINLPNGQHYVRCAFDDCSRYFHLNCIHNSFPDEQLNESHLEDLRENGIHCPVCEPGKIVKNY